MKRALTIAASDSAAASGVQLDLKVFARCGVYGVCAVALIAAQDTFTVRRLFKPAPSIVGAQIDAVVSDIGADACKIGWFRSPELTTLIAGRVRRRNLQPVVLDPCLWSERGEELTPPRTVKRLVREVLPLTTVLTVTTRELGVLAGLPVATEEERRAAVERILSLGTRSIVLEDPWGAHGAFVCDAAGIRRAAVWVAGAQTPAGGEGALFSAALTAALAQGRELTDAVRFAVEFLTASRDEMHALGKGLSVWG